MAKDKPNDSISLQSILETSADDDLAVETDASTATDANHPEEIRDADSEARDAESEGDAPITQSRRGFGKLLLAGATGAVGLSGTDSAEARTGWRAGYQKYMQEYIPSFYETVPTKQNLYKCVKYVAKTTNFWETLGKKMYLDRAVVTAAYAYPVPNYKKVEKKAWDGILGDMYAGMPEKYRKKRRYPVAVPVVVVYLYDGYYNAVAYLRPYGKSYKSYGYAIRSGYYQKKDYKSKSDYESNTWWWTEDGWGDAGDTQGGILDGVPTGMTN